MALSQALLSFLLLATVTGGPAATGSDDSDLRERHPQTYSSRRITIQEDHHEYYNSTTVRDAGLAHRLWTELAGREDVRVHPVMSRSHRRATTVQLSFDFPFYGHPVRNVTVSTGGFVYMGDFIHSWLAAGQYVAPLMANFDSSISNDSFIKYLDNGTAFTVQWERVRLQDRAFSFQLTLRRCGDIVFVYQSLPLSVQDIADHHHPVKVGISDSYVTENNVYLVRRKTIYVYHRAAPSREDIQSGTVVVLSALPTCPSAEDCHTCLTAVPHFQCRWCEGMCSDGTDRRRQERLEHSCVASAELCEQRAPPTPQLGEEAARSGGGLHAQGPASSSAVSVSGGVAILSAAATLVTAAAV